MSRSLPQQVLARRALVTDHASQPSRVRHGVAVVGISVLGLAVAGSVTATGNAQDTAPHFATVADSAASGGPTGASVGRPAGVVPPAFARRDTSDRRAAGPVTVELRIRPAARDRALRLRSAGLKAAAEAADATAASIRDARAQRAAQARARREQVKREAASKRAAARRGARAAAPTPTTPSPTTPSPTTPRPTTPRSTTPRPTTSASTHPGHASLPITSGFHIAARFGQRGVWARYHTGLDFAAPVGTTVHAVADGTVTHAGFGSAGWAGRYVTIRHADGRTTLYAHMSAVSVSGGQHVSGGQRIGAVGMTGRTFGPHVHVELYPRGVRPGKIYQATNPAPWMRAHGLHL